MDEKSGDDTFEQRLRAARQKQGLDVPAAGTKADPGGLDRAAWRIGVRVGVEMVSALVVAVAIGWALDRWLGTSPVFLGVFVLLGGAAGVLNVWRMFVPRK
jgi:ATP synthase protein I